MAINNDISSDRGLLQAMRALNLDPQKGGLELPRDAATAIEALAPAPAEVSAPAVDRGELALTTTGWEAGAARPGDAFISGVADARALTTLDLAGAAEQGAAAIVDMLRG